MLDYATQAASATQPTTPAPVSAARPPIDPLKIALFPARAFLAFGWTRAGVEKLIERDWWTGASIRDFVAEQEAEALPFMADVGAAVAGWPAPFVAAIVLIAELAIGALLLRGKLLTGALGTGIGLNVVFVLFGAVSPSAFYLVLELTLLLAAGVARPAIPERTLVLGLLGSAGSAIVFAPFVSTLHPAEVIHDPALMLVTIAVLLGATQLLLLAGQRADTSPL